MSQKKPQPKADFLYGSARNIIRTVNELTDLLNDITLDISFYGACEHRVRQNGDIYPALYQSNTKDWLDALANDQWVAYGFWDLLGEEEYTYSGEGSVNSWAKITREVALIVYGNVDKLLWKDEDTSVDYRYDKQLIKAQINGVLMRHKSRIDGYVQLNKIYDQDIEEIFAGFDIDGTKQYLQSPMFAFRFECTITTDEACD